MSPDPCPPHSSPGPLHLLPPPLSKPQPDPRRPHLPLRVRSQRVGAAPTSFLSARLPQASATPHPSLPRAAAAGQRFPAPLPPRPHSLLSTLFLPDLLRPTTHTSDPPNHLPLLPYPILPTTNLVPAAPHAGPANCRCSSRPGPANCRCSSRPGPAKCRRAPQIPRWPAARRHRDARPPRTPTSPRRAALPADGLHHCRFRRDFRHSLLNSPMAHPPPTTTGVARSRRPGTMSTAGSPSQEANTPSEPPSGSDRYHVRGEIHHAMRMRCPSTPSRAGSRLLPLPPSSHAPWRARAGAQSPAAAASNVRTGAVQSATTTVRFPRPCSLSRPIEEKILLDLILYVICDGCNFFLRHLDCSFLKRG